MKNYEGIKKKRKEKKRKKKKLTIKTRNLGVQGLEKDVELGLALAKPKATEASVFQLESKVGRKAQNLPKDGPHLVS